ncbi:hypothetical protein THRCLA_11952, partial [Thraustotheca clavata]
MTEEVSMDGFAKKDDILGPSLLDVMQNMNLSSLKATFCTRSCLVARFPETDADGTKKIQDFFTKTVEMLNCDASGLLLMQEGTLCALLECTADQFSEICVEIRDFKYLSDVKVVATCDDNSTKLLQSIYFRKLLISRPTDVNDGDITLASSTMFFNLITLARRLGSQPS